MRESKLIQHIYTHNAALPANVVIPPGDDMGAISVGGEPMLVTVDQLAENIHFTFESASIEQVGRKAITRNLSDVAAMGAVPSGAVVAGCLPRLFGEDRANALFDAMRSISADYNCPLVGGDISIWDGDLILTVTVFAQTHGVAPVLRKGATVGDLICVTGQLGGSLQSVPNDDDGVNPYTHHLDFSPRVVAGRYLATSTNHRPNCMVDLSDGLATDVVHLCNAAEPPLGAKLNVDLLPVSAGARIAELLDGMPAWQHALTDGEDYELCFTWPSELKDEIPTSMADVAVTVVGEMVNRDSGDEVDGRDDCLELVNNQGESEQINEAGWEHRS